MKKLYSTYVMKWWEVGLLKLYVASGALVIGAYYSDIISKYYTLLIVIFVLLLVYFLYYLVKK